MPSWLKREWAFGNGRPYFYGGGDDRDGYEKRLCGENWRYGFVVNAMPAESAKHTQEEIVKALIAREAMALKDADIG